jgi:hypothetical protein
MLICAINRKQPYLNQLSVLEKSIKANSPKDVMDFKILDAEKTKEYMVCYRTILFDDAINNKKIEKVAWLDADCLVRKPLDGLWEDMRENTIKVLYRPEKAPKRRFQAGVFAIGNGFYTAQMVSEWNRMVQKCPQWYRDQECLYAAYMKFKRHIKLIKLSEAYNDSEFKDKSVIWHSKEHHFEDAKFQKEFKKYL